MPETVKQILDRLQSDAYVDRYGKVITDTSDFMCINSGDIIRGKRLDNWVYKLDMDHRTYFKDCLPGILKKFIKACDAIQYLHENGEKHGDIRRDHLWVPRGSDDYVWIDFDYTFTFNENPFGMDVFGLSGLLLYLTGMGFYSFQDIQAMYAKKKQIPDLEQGDFLLVFKNRLANLRKIFPYIPEDLNWILMHFSGSANVYYDTVEEFLSDLKPCVNYMG